MNVLRSILLRECQRSRAAVLQLRWISSLQTERLEYEERGNPSEVVKLKREELQIDLKPGQVLVKFLASPVNPADINTIQGSHLIKLDFTILTLLL